MQGILQPLNILGKLVCYSTLEYWSLLSLVPFFLGGGGGYASISLSYIYAHISCVFVCHFLYLFLFFKLFKDEWISFIF